MDEDQELPPQSVPDVGRTPTTTARTRVLISFTSGAGNTVIVAALGAFAIRVITLHVTPLEYGNLVTALTFATTAMIVSDLGITSITGREIASRPSDAAEILGHNLGLRLALSVLMIPLLNLVSLLAYRQRSGELILAIVILTIAIPFDALRATSLGYYVATIRTYYGSTITLIQQVIYVGGVCITIYTGHGIIGCALSYLVATSISSVLAYSVVRREMSFKPLFNTRQWRIVMRQSISLGAILVVNVLYLRADIILLGRLVSLQLVGLYGVAYSFITFFSVVPALLGVSLLPLLTRASPEELRSLVRRANHLLAFAGVLFAVGTLLFAPQAIRALSGVHFSGAATSLRILSLATIFTFMNTAYGYAAVARNRHHRIIVVSVVGLVLNVVLNIIAIPRWGITGSAYATLISEFVALILIRFVYSKDVDAKTSLLASAARPFLVGAVVLVVGRLLIVPARDAASELSLLWTPVIALLYVALLALVRGLPVDLVTLVKSTYERLARRRNVPTGPAA
jgi:O-antigen/teichoic acid export membrane protein